MQGTMQKSPASRTPIPGGEVSYCWTRTRGIRLKTLKPPPSGRKPPSSTGEREEGESVVSSRHQSFRDYPRVVNARWTAKRNQSSNNTRDLKLPWMNNRCAASSNLSLSLSLSVGIAINRLVDPRHGLWINVASTFAGYFSFVSQRAAVRGEGQVGHEGGFSLFLPSIEYLSRIFFF